MKTIRLNKLKIQNFKGIKSLEIDFKDETIIEGKNGVGKTSVFDAYSWLLFGKNSQSQTDFGLKTVDSNNNVIHNLEHSVEGTFMIDDSEVVLKRLLREKWTKKKGSETPELTGNETIFFINEVPKSLSEYKLFVDGIISEESQKVLSNPLYFNQTMKWQDRRTILSKLAGEIDRTTILNNLSENHRIELEKMLSTDKTLEDYKKEFAAKRKNIKDELDLIPSRIDEANRSLPEIKNWKQIEEEIIAKNNEINSIEAKIEDSTKQQESIFEKINQSKNLKFKKEQEIQFVLNEESVEANKEYYSCLGNVNHIKHNIDLNKNNSKQQAELIEALEVKIQRLERLNIDLRSRFTEENAKVFTFDSTAFSCNSCQREYDTEKIEEIKSNALIKFKENQDKIISEIRSEGQNNKSEIEKLQKEIEVFKQAIEKLNSIIETKESELKELKKKMETLELSKKDSQDSSKIIQLKKELSEIVVPEVSAIDNSNLKSQKAELQTEIDTLKLQLHDKVQIEKGNLRIEELIKQQRLLAQQIANFEKQEIAIESFNNERNNLIEKAVNDKFSLVNFKLFEVQMNKGINEICEATVDGVLFNDVNTANKINAGLDVINVLSNYYEVIAPVFLDNRESTTNIIDCNSQIISLFVNPNCETLKIN